MSYLHMYYEWIKTGEIPSCGLCGVLGDKIKIFEPTLEYSQQIYSWVENVNDWYWGYNGSYTINNDKDIRSRTFTPLRQNIVLFLAAMNGEL